MLKPQEQWELLANGYGITNVVDRPSKAADELSIEEIKAGAIQLIQKVEYFQPQVLAILGLTVFKTAFGRANASVGLQQEELGNTRLWVLPNTSGLNAHYTPLMLAELFAVLRQYAEDLK